MAKEVSLNISVADFTILSYRTFLYIDFNLQPYSYTWFVFGKV